MPFVDTKVTVKLKEEQIIKLKSEFAKALNLIDKPEEYLMLGFNDQYSLYFRGNKLEKGAFVSVDMFGQVNNDSDKVTKIISEALYQILDIPKDNIYIRYQGTDYWGHNGHNF